MKTILKGHKIENPLTKKTDITLDPNKVAFFVSTSVGCEHHCKFCYLTVKKFPYHDLTFKEIIDNLKAAILEAIEINPSIKQKYFKLSWMGMGDALIDAEKVSIVTRAILYWITSKHLFKGVYGIDIGSIVPDNTSTYLQSSLEHLGTLDKWLKMMAPAFNIQWPGKSPLKFYYSLHTFSPKLRASLIPTGLKLGIAVPLLKLWALAENMDLIFHYLLLDSKNDDIERTEDLVEVWKSFGLQEFELRILRYNECENTPYRETKQLDEVLAVLNKGIKNLKFQISTGSEIKAACGQFIMKQFEEAK
jgi:adenine C2-methylase RlmN of 23S rRNA A2503 and tRNA A37